jgi:hypothetical protein
MIRIILLTLATNFVLPLFAQLPNGPTIYIMAESQVNGIAFSMCITDKGKRMKVVYKVRDSVSVKEEQDTVLAAYRKLGMSITNISLQNDTLKGLMQKIDSLMQFYTYYSMDSITIRKKRNRSYTALMKTILKAPIDTLLQGANNRNRIVLDGTRFTFVLQNNGYSRKVNAHSPTKTSHPLLYALVKHTLALYRQKRPLNFLLQPNRTNGY